VKKILTLCVVCLLSIVLAAPADAGGDLGALDQHMKEVRRKALEKRNSALSVLLTLTDDQTKAFRPLQQAYDKDLGKLFEKQRKLAVEFSDVYDKLDAATAEKLSQQYFDLQREHLAMQQKYLRSISEAVSPVAAVLFIQLQARFETQVEMERMKYSPLAE
jgi:uncharacterized membrane protein